MTLADSRGIRTVGDILARCRTNTVTGCWHWLGAMSTDGIPRIHTFDHERGDKRTMSGPKAAWNIAHNAAPRPGWLVFRSCQVRDCMNPVHLSQARDKAEIGQHIRRAGTRIGTALVSRRANIAKAMAANGVTPTSAAIVSAIRLAPPEITGLQLAAIHGIASQTVSLIRRYRSHVGVAA